MQLLASRPCTIVTGSTSGSGAFGMTTVIIVGFVGYGYIWWKGWKLSDVMFVTRRGLSDACTSVGKQLELVSSSLAAAKRHLSSRVDVVDRNLEECKELTVATKHEVSKLHGDLSGFHMEIECVHRAIQNLETKLGKLEGNQELTARGIYHLCDFVQRCEQSRNTKPIQELQEISSALTSGNFRTSSTKASNGTLAADESSSSTPSSSRFGWKLPGISILSRTNNSAS